MLSCKQATEVCSAEMDRRLRLGEQVSLRAHLMFCTACSRYRGQMKTLRQAMRAYAEGQAPTGETGTPSTPSDGPA
jgi:predicted anti-sigma-YlaC factor YlaD